MRITLASATQKLMFEYCRQKCYTAELKCNIMSNYAHKTNA